MRKLKQVHFLSESTKRPFILSIKNAKHVLTLFLFIASHSFCFSQVVIGIETCTLPNGTTVTLTYSSRDGVFIDNCHEDIFVEIEICGDPGQGTSIDLVIDAEYRFPAFQVDNMNGDFIVTEIIEKGNVDSYVLTLNPTFDINSPCQTYTSTLRNNTPPVNSWEKPDQSSFVTHYLGTEFCNLDTPEIQYKTSTFISFTSLLDNIENDIMEEEIIACSNNIEKRFTIPANLEIDTDYCFKNALISMSGEFAGITVKSGFTLTIEDSKITYCSQFWEGITVEPFAKLIVKNATIEGANSCIVVQNHGQVNLNQVDFFDFRFSGLSFIDSNYNFSSSYVEDFEGITFEGTGLMPNFKNPFTTGPSLIPYTEKPNIGVFVRNFLYIQLVGDFDPSSQVTGDSKLINYKNLNNGILSQNCLDLQVGFSNFESLNRGIYIENVEGSVFGANAFNFSFDGLENEPGANAFGVEDFENVNFGIEVKGSDVSILDASFQEIHNTAIHLNQNTNHHHDIRYNTINSHGIGIHGNLSFPSTALIEQNDLSTLSGHQANILCNNGLFDEIDDQEGGSWDIMDNHIINDDAGFYGISIAGGNNFNVHSNRIEFGGRGQGVSVLLSPDISVFDNDISGGDRFTALSTTLSTSGDYRENNLDGGQYGAVFKLDNGRCDFRCNDISNFETGVSLNANAIIGTQYSKYNCWINNSNLDLSHAGMEAVSVEKSKFTVLSQGDQNNDCYTPPYFQAYSGTGEVEDFYKQKVGMPDPNCQEERPLSPPSEDYIQDVVNAELYDLAEGDALNWMSQFVQFPYISQNDFSHTTMEIDVNNYLSTTNSVSFFHDIWLEVKLWQADQFPISENILDDLNSYNDLYQSIQNEDEDSNLSTMTSQLTQLTNQIQTEIDNGYPAYTHWKSEKDATFENIVNQMDNFIGDNSFENNMKFSMLTYLRLLEGGQDALVSTDWENIFALATQCPADDGPGVLLARIIYNTHILTDFSDYDECVETQFRQTDNEDKRPIIYPNPNNGDFTIELEEDADLRLLNQFGKILSVYKLKRGNQSIQLNNLPAGIYYLTNGSNLNTKIVYIK